MANNTEEAFLDKKNEGFAGTLKNIQLNDLIQMCCLAAVSLTIRVRKGDRQGTIYIQDGEIVHAICGDIDGEEAFFKIVGWESGSFETLDLGAIAAPTIEKGYQFLIIEAARRADEETPKSTDSADLIENDRTTRVQDKLRVLIVDDSPMMCKILTSMLGADRNIHVIGAAKNGEEALAMIEDLQPDLITMDVNMPVMDGSTALKHIMIKNPCPVLIMSNMSSGSQGAILNFLNLGAVDFMSKPVKSGNILIQQQKIVERVHRAARARLKHFKRVRTPKLQAHEYQAADNASPCEFLVVVNSGVGGHLEVVNLITGLPKNMNAGVVSFQSIHPALVPTLSKYLDARCVFDVASIEDGMPLFNKRCYIGSNERSIEISSTEDGYTIGPGNMKLNSDEERNYFDLFLHSVADTFSDRVLVVLLSGAELGCMDGLKKVRERNGRIIAQQLTSCILPDPLKNAMENNLIEEEVKTFEIAEQILKYAC